jgi:Ca2+-binding EF-hand superfamily protein
MQSPSKLNQTYTVEEDDAGSQRNDPIPQPKFTRELPPSPTKGAQSPGYQSPIIGNRSLGTTIANADASSKLPANQVREIREAFQVLDRDNDGLVNKDDVADVLVNLGRWNCCFLPNRQALDTNQETIVGQDASPSALSRFFPPGASQTINFPTFLNTLSQLMSPMSSSQELLNALAAFDDDDNGQIDVAELRDALLHTLPEDGGAPLTEQQIDEVFSGFTGRRAFGGRGAKAGGAKRGEVFQYHDFVRTVVGGGENGNNGRREAGAAQA